MNIRIIDYRPPRIALMLTVMAVLLHWVTPLTRIDIYSNFYLGVMLGASGFCVMMWGWWLFRKYDTAICPAAQPRSLVTTGIYKLTRNPMYLGMVTMLLAIALVIGSLPFYVASAAYFVIINTAFCPYEEQKLIETFGAVYIDYKNKVRRWL